MDVFVLSYLVTTWDAEETSERRFQVTAETVEWVGTAEELRAGQEDDLDVMEALETLCEGLAAHVDIGGGAAAHTRLRRFELDGGETLLGFSTEFLYVGKLSGHVESRGRPERGTRTTSFGDVGYWRMSRTLPGFLSGCTLTPAGRAW